MIGEYTVLDLEGGGVQTGPPVAERERCGGLSEVECGPWAEGQPEGSIVEMQGGSGAWALAR